MSVLRFDEKALMERLERLPNRLRVAFAAVCAQRQLPNYIRFSQVAGQGNPQTLIYALGCIWDDLEGKVATESQLRLQLDACMSLIPDEEQDDYDGLSYYAEDAVAAAAYTVEARLKSDLRDVVRAADRAYEALDEFVGVARAGGIDQKEEERVRSHPLVQAELRRQRVDLSQLEKVAAGLLDEKQGIVELRHRAQMDAKEFFGQ